MKPGLVSISFRKLAPAEIARLCTRAGLGLVEWGGDVHVPHGNLEAAKSVRRLTADAGLHTAAYGSYLRLGQPEPSLEAVLDTAAELGAPVVRVWAGSKGSAEATSEDWRRVVEAATAAAEAALARGLRLACEFHGGTLTDTTSSALRLLAHIAPRGIRSLWQPPVGSSDQEALASLQAILPHLAHIHVFHWQPDAGNRRPLAEGAARWRKFLRAVRESGLDPALLLEFLPGDDPALLPREADSLRRIIEQSGENPSK